MTASPAVDTWVSRPLLATEDTDDSFERPNSSRQTKPAFLTFCTRRWFIFCGVPALMLLMVILVILSFFAQNGAFKQVLRDVRIANGTVTEPNTHLQFPLNRKELIDGTPRNQRLIGLFLKTRHVPQLRASLRVFTLAAYVDREAGRRELLAYKDGPPMADPHSYEFRKFIDILSSGKLTFTAEYKLVMNIPGSQMHDSWVNDLGNLWASFGLSNERVQLLKQTFSNWFLKRGFHFHDDILIEFNSITKVTSVSFNGTPLQPCTDPMFGKAFIMHEFLQNGHLAADLLSTLWNTEYDDE